MTLFQVTVPRDNDWSIIQEFLNLDFLHYIDVNAHKQPHQLLYTDLLRRIEDTNKKISFIEDLFKEYNVHMSAPTSSEEL